MPYLYTILNCIVHMSGKIQGYLYKNIDTFLKSIGQHFFYEVQNLSMAFRFLSNQRKWQIKINKWRKLIDGQTHRASAELRNVIQNIWKKPKAVSVFDCDSNKRVFSNMQETKTYFYQWLSQPFFHFISNSARFQFQ